MGQGKSRGLQFFLWKENENHQLGTGFFVNQTLVSTIKIV